MPNHVRNRVEFVGDDARINELLDFVSSVEDEPEGGSEFDFNKIIPQPSNVYKGSFGLGKDEEGIREKGMITQYEFNTRNWGTKWNAYNVNVYNNIVEFDTAWSMPNPVFVELSKQYPDLTLAVSYADEDIGSNCGKILYKDGQAIEDVVFDKYSDSSCDFATRLRYNQSYEEFKADVGLEQGRWVMHEINVVMYGFDEEIASSYSFGKRRLIFAFDDKVDKNRFVESLQITNLPDVCFYQSYPGKDTVNGNKIYHVIY